MRITLSKEEFIDAATTHLEKEYLKTIKYIKVRDIVLLEHKTFVENYSIPENTLYGVNPTIYYRFDNENEEFRLRFGELSAIIDRHIGGIGLKRTSPPCYKFLVDEKDREACSKPDEFWGNASGAIIVDFEAIAK